MRRRSLIITGLEAALAELAYKNKALAQPASDGRLTKIIVVVAIDRHETVLNDYRFRLISRTKTFALLSESAPEHEYDKWSLPDSNGLLIIEDFLVALPGAMMIYAKTNDGASMSAQCATASEQDGYAYFQLQPIYGTKTTVTRRFRQNGITVEERSTSETAKSIRMSKPTQLGEAND